MENQNFDALRDVAYAEIYATVLRMEKEQKIETDLDTESLCYACWQMANEFTDKYNNLCEYAETVDYYGMLDKFIYDKAMELWKPLKHFDIEIDANVTMTYKALARDRKDAEEMAHKFMESPQFDQWLRTKLRIYEAEIGDVIEGGK